MYANLIWVDHAITPDRTFSVTENEDGTITLTPAGTVVQQGTNLSAANFNNIEMGVSDHDLAVGMLHMLARNLIGRADEGDTNYENIIAEFTPEEHLLTLTAGTSTSVSLDTTRTTANYTVEIIPSLLSTSNGDFATKSYAKNGFYIQYNGSNDSASVTVKIRGGFLA